MNTIKLTIFFCFILTAVAFPQTEKQFDVQSTGESLSGGDTVSGTISSKITPDKTYATFAMRTVNLLGNGGFECWGLGAIPAGPVCPELWYPMGSTANLYAQTDIVCTRKSPEELLPCEFGSGLYVAQLTASDPSNFVAQDLESFDEFRGRWITFSVDLTTTFGVAQPSLEIDDGMTASFYSDTIYQCDEKRFTVRHQVSEDATRLSFRIYPDQTVVVDHAMAVPGSWASAVYIPRGNPDPGLMQTPLGTIMDWYRFDASIPVPEGFAIADGSAINDPRSPFYGRNTPDLVDRFVLGVASAEDTGVTGGSASVDLSHNHYMYHKHSGTTNPSSSFYQVYGIVPGYTCSRDTHTHSFNTNGPSTNYTGDALEDMVSIIPPYVGLLKIIRIK